MSQQEMFKQSVETSIKSTFAGNNVPAPKLFKWSPGEEKTASMLGLKVTKPVGGSLTIFVPEYKPSASYNSSSEMEKFIVQKVNATLKQMGNSDRVKLSDISHTHKNGMIVYDVAIPYSALHK